MDFRHECTIYSAEESELRSFFGQKKSFFGENAGLIKLMGKFKNGKRAVTGKLKSKDKLSIESKLLTN